MRNLVIFLALVLCSFASQAEILRFGIVPQQSAQALAKTWGPIVSELKQQTGLDIVFATAPDIPEFEARLLKGEYHLSYMNPYHYTLFSDTPGYKAIAKAKNKTIKGIIVTHQESTIQSIEDLHGQTLAFPAPRAFAATMIPLAELDRQGIQVTPNFVKTHDSVYLTVERGLYPAGGGVIRTFNNMPESTKANVRILWESKGYTPHAIAVHPELAPDKASSLQAALVELSAHPTGQALLKAIGIAGFEAANNSDWDDVRALSISSPE